MHGEAIGNDNKIGAADLTFRHHGHYGIVRFFPTRINAIWRSEKPRPGSRGQ
jgi:hypothetical protein